jgi:hypothetical protein
MTKLKRLRARLDQMTDLTYALLRGALLLSSTMVLCALVLYLSSGDPTIAGQGAYKTAQELIALGAVTLLLATIASAIAEEIGAGK